MPAVSVKGLKKRYRDVEAVSSVDLQIERGEVYAILGPNGAGKTTTIEILEGFRNRDAGHIDVLGFDPADPLTSRQLRERMGVVLQELAIEPFLTVRQVLLRNAGYYPSPRPVGEVLELVGLASKADKRVKTLSGGQQRRLDLGLGIVGNPELLFLDEPTTGFDPSARRDAWELVRSFAGGGTTVILTTHYMDEAESLADRVAVLASGAIVAEGTPRSLGGRDVSEARISFGLPPGTPASALPVAAKTAGNGSFEIRTNREVEVLAALTNWAIRESVELTALRVERMTLEDVYLKLTGHMAESTESTAAR
ncbi:MAG: ABC transporter ATP-binding protein [Acidimicrobiales bacterium]